MTKIPLNPLLAYSALAVHWQQIAQRNAGPFSPPAWRDRPAKPLGAWQANGLQPAGREARPVATLYLFQFDEPVLISDRELAGFVLVSQDGGGFVENWWQGTEGASAVTIAAMKL